MGLIERIQSGAVFIRNVVSITNTPSTGNVEDFKASYILLGISADNPCRVRLYYDSSSVEIDAPRPSSSFDYSASVGLNLDAALTPGTQSLVFNPPIIASTFSTSKTWYNIEGPTPTTVNILYYPIEDSPITRTYLNIPNISGVTLGAYETSSGNYTTPKSFLLLNAISDSNPVRLRLYSKPIEQIDNSEKSRPFATETVSGSHLICDMLLESSSYLYNISPVLQAYNLEDYLIGSNRVGYILENLLGSTQTNVYVGVRIYPVED